MKRILRTTSLIIISLMMMQPFFTTAQSNQYLHFDRVDDYVSLQNGSQYIANSNAFTMSGWFYTDQIAYGQGMMGFRGASQGFYMIQLDNGIIECRFQNSSGTLFEHVAPANTIIPETWQHFAWVYDGSQILLYVNGILNGSAAASGQITDANIQFTIGRSILGTLNFYFGGRADEVSVWDKALTSADITDLMANELTGTEPNLQLYYKINQGDPGGNNTTISSLISEIGGGTRDADLLFFALNGPTSNFNGTLNTSFQAISLDPMANKLITDAPFDLVGTASSGLTVEFEVVSGPATISGSTVTLTGTEGEVTIKASQPGDATYDPAADVINSFMVLDPETHLPEIEIRNPLAGDVYVPVLTEIQLAAMAKIEYPELFSVSDVVFSIDGEIITAMDWGNEHFTAWWKPQAYGAYTLSISSNNNFGHAQTIDVSLNIVQAAADMSVTAVEDVLLNTSIPTQTVEAELPGFTGAFNQIMATLSVHCPPGLDCGEWDRKASIEAKTHTGQWIEIIRYITPYGVECNHTTDLTDYMSMLQGKVAFRLNCSTFDNGYVYDLDIDYKAGAPEHMYSTVEVIWQDTYPFGDYANLQPVEIVDHAFADSAVASKLKIMNTGHGWGDLNTGNAAEFYEATHNIKTDGDNNPQHLWAECNPNPDGCSNQNGTWYFDRAGWCPGSIAVVYDYDLSTYIGSGSVNLQYEFFDGYVDYCHPNHPACVTGSTCDDCEDTYNPHYIITGNLVTFFDSPSIDVSVEELTFNKYAIQAYPNPNFGSFVLSSEMSVTEANVSIYTLLGTEIMSFEWDGSDQYIDMTSEKQGVYMITIQVGSESETKRIIVQ